MDTSEQTAIASTRQEKRRRSVEENRRIVEETLETGASVARRHAVNANQVFYWRKKYQEGRLGKNQSVTTLLKLNSFFISSRFGVVLRE
jgi:transposase